LLWSVAGFGGAIVVFGLSPWFWLSSVALVFTGAFDNISVVVRQSLVQLLTPDDLRGRVTAVNPIFIGSSNEIGAMRAGLMAALIGPIGAVVWGGLGTMAVAAVVARAVPGLRRLPGLHSLRPNADLQQLGNFSLDFTLPSRIACRRKCPTTRPARHSSSSR
jgi:MFS family permease